MSEIIRYTRIGEEDINFGKGTFEARLADGRVVILQQVDLGTLLSDASRSTQDVTLGNVTATSLTVSGAVTSGTLQVPEKADPGSPVSGELWINSSGTIVEYADDAATPTAHEIVGNDTTQTLTNKTLTAPAISAPVLSGTATGTYTLAGTPTIDTPTITNAALSGTTTIAAGAVITDATINSPSISSPSISDALNLPFGQIIFPSTQNASLNVNTLDDYEEGTWTPSVGGTAVYNYQRGWYTKIGQQVTLVCDISITTIGTGSASTITGVPFPASGQGTSTGSVYWGNAVISPVFAIALLTGGSSSVSIYGLTAGGPTLNILLIMGDSTNIGFTLTYFI